MGFAPLKQRKGGVDNSATQNIGSNQGCNPGSSAKVESAHGQAPRVRGRTDVKLLPIGRAVAVLGLLAAITLGILAAGAGAGPRGRRPKAVTLTAVYFVTGTYANAFDAGGQRAGCEAGKESAAFTVKVRFSRIRLHLVPQTAFHGVGTDLTSGQWTEDGTQWYTNSIGNPCSAPGSTKPLHCSGSIGYRDIGVQSGSADIYVHKTIVHFILGVLVGEEKTAACGEHYGGYGLSVIPYLGVRDALEPWNHSDASVPLRTLAAAHKGATLQLKIVHRPSTIPNWDPATCDGKDGQYSGQTCTGSLTITDSGLTIRMR
jgi:hypothetical protein